MLNSLAQQIERILDDAVGGLLAKATLKKNCALMGASPDDLTTSQLDDLAGNIEKSVSFFSGKDSGVAAAAKIRSLGG